MPFALDFDGSTLSRDDYDSLGFEERDALDALADVTRRELVYGLPARPGTRR